MSTKKIEDAYPLTPAQEGMLFHTLMLPGSGAYVTQIICTIKNLHVGAFEKAWEGLVQHHGIFRAAFVWKKLKRPLQVIGREARLPIIHEDWRHLTADQQQERFQAYVKDDRTNGLNLSKAPLMRITLIHMVEGEYRFIWTHHHLLLDGWSTSLIFKELLARYKSYKTGETFQAEYCPPFREYVRWLQEQDATKAEIYWKETLTGYQGGGKFIDRMGAVGIGEERSYGEHLVRLSQEMTSALQKTAKENRLTVNTIVQCAWGILLGRYSGEKDVMYGATVSGRGAEIPGIENMVGMFINTLPVRVKIEEEEEVTGWMKKKQEEMMEMMQYEHSALVKVGGWSEIGRGERLFESIVVFENYPVDEAVRSSNQVLEILDMRSIEDTSYPLVLLAQPGPHLNLRLVYDKARLHDETINRMGGHLFQILSQVIKTPKARISDIDILTETERAAILSFKTKVDYGQPQCVHRLIEQQVEKTPDAIAIVYESQHLTYREMNERANRVAHYLMSRGVKAETLVGIRMERSLEMVVGLLGILKAGGAYVPLDPSYPKARLEYMVRDSGAELILTQERLKGELGETGAEEVSVDGQWEEISQHSGENTVSKVDGDNLAYVIYTSGSTGEPKGAANTHRGVSNRLQWMQEEYRLTGEDAVMQKTPISFDVSVWEYLWPIMSGAKIVMARAEGHKDSEYLVELIKRERVSVMHFVPAMLRVFLKEKGLEECESVRQVISSGEELSKELEEEFGRRMKGARLANLYGPTEASIDVTYWNCVKEEEGSVPIGRPIANTRIYILDDRERVVPIGVIGEIYIAGEGLARGYIKKGGMTAERFKPDPNSGEEGGRMYRTGDEGRYREDGAIEYKGRKDKQVKIRGNRIELGEIEEELKKEEGVKEVIVEVKEGQGGEKVLVGYVEMEEGKEMKEEEMRERLKERMPEYMVVRRYVKMERMPMQPNGKIDRKALPEPEDIRKKMKEEYVGPRSELEESITEVWKEVLQLDKVGINDNFFDLGGHSISLIELQHKLQEALQKEIIITDLLKYPSVNLFAKYLIGQSGDAKEASQSEQRAAIRRESMKRYRSLRS